MANINQTLQEAGDGLGFMLDRITDPLVALIIGLGVASAIVLLFKGLITKIKSTTDKA